MELFQSLNDEGVTIIMITHDPDIADYATRKVLIRDGELFTDEEQLHNTLPDKPVLTHNTDKEENA